MDWISVNDKLPETRAPVLLCVSYIQEARVGRFENGAFWSWRKGERERVRFDTTHWTPISWPQDDNETIQTWEGAFAVGI
jgi:hypothetical protein